MKVIRIVQLILVLALIAYLLILHNINPQTIILPFLLPLPTALVLAVTIILSFLAGWGASFGRIWTLSRENRKLERRLIELGEEPETPVIPDRTDDAKDDDSNRDDNRRDKKKRLPDPRRRA